MVRVLPAQRRPADAPVERLAILEPRAARGRSLAETARRLPITSLTVSSWSNRLEGEGPKGPKGPRALVEVCERAPKNAILHRKNALFYKTKNGARVGDVFMSLIHTTELGEANPFDYLVALQRHADAVEGDPAAWMPWNFTDALGRLAPDAPSTP